MDLRALDRRALDLLDDLVTGLRPADLARPTPCTDWDLAELLRHLVSENTAFAHAIRHGPAADWTMADWDSGRLGTDPAATYSASAAAVTAAFATDGALERAVTVREFGTFSGEVAIGMHFIDSVAHGWDVAKTLGRPYAPDEDIAAAALGLARRIPAAPGSRGPGAAFGPVLDVAADGNAAAFPRALALLGRSPDWHP